MAIEPLAAVPETPSDLVALRRDLHRNPELRFHERRTAGLVADRLLAAGYQVRTGIGGTGVIAHLDGRDAGPHVVVRADLDALPVTDAKEVDYASTVAGAAHACGHDVHTVVGVGVADRFAAIPPQAGRISFLFQPAEERPFGEPSGASAVLAEGVLDEPRPDAIIALHCWPDLPVGSIGIDDRIAMGAKDAFRIVYRGTGAHAATPSRGRDAILGIAQATAALYQALARTVDPGELASLNIGTIQGGSSQSVVAERAEATGTLRTVDPEVRTRLRGTIERTASGVAATLGLQCSLTWADEMPAIVNDPVLVACAHEVATEVLGADRTVRLSTPPMTADDFALLAERAPALYLKLGVCGNGTCAPLHSGSFDVDERAIGVGVAVLHGIARRLLGGALGETPA